MPIRSADGDFLACDECGSAELTYNGHNTTKARKQRYQCKSCGHSTVTPVYLNAEVTERTVKLAKRHQHQQDTNRVERKAFREHARLDNMVVELNEKLLQVLENNKFHKFKEKKVVPDTPIGMIQLSDLHFNELVNLPSNKYDFTIASQRLYKHAITAIKDFKAKGVTKVVIAVTGDLLNSDRRLDEITMAATNRTQATFLGVDILQQLISHVAKHFTVDVSWVVGNEGRVNKEPGWNEIVASDNYDHMIMLILSKLFDGSGVNFHRPVNPSEQIVNINGTNILLVHGHGGGLIKNNLSDSTTKIRSKYAEQSIIIDYIITGHIHEALISDLCARSGSTVGANSYSHNALSLNGRASQNYYIIYPDKSINGTKVDLQNYEGIEGYKIDKSLEAYNTKSANKTQDHHTIFQIQI